MNKVKEKSLNELIGINSEKAKKQEEAGTADICSVKVEKVIAILKDICDATIIPNERHNERYLHHYFSRKIQEYYPICYNDVVNSKLHPEWPTYKKNVIDYGRYKEVDKQYVIDDITGTAGFIDFAIGDYLTPKIAIEFKAGFGWKEEGIVFDFMKLMDNKNPFEECISFNIIFREKELSRALNTAKVNEAKDIFIERLGSRLAKDRKFQFWIVEIADKGAQKRIWYMDNLGEEFKEIKRN
jgi:hypothetical protein